MGSAYLWNKMSKDAMTFLDGTEKVDKDKGTQDFNNPISSK